MELNYVTVILSPSSCLPHKITQLTAVTVTRPNSVDVVRVERKSAFRLGARVRQHASRHVAQHVLATLFNGTFHTRDTFHHMPQDMRYDMSPV